MDTPFLRKVPGDDDEPKETTHTVPFGTLAEAIRRGQLSRRELKQGERIHHYRIIEQLGAGGFGSVFLAEHVYLKQHVALKTLRSPVDESGELAERFLREAQVLAILSGPHVLRVQDASVFENIPYVVTELLRGRTLGHYLEGHGPLTTNHALDLLEQLGEVLIRQERFQILHRDIKPSNVWVRDDGTFCLMDYGLVGFADHESSGELGVGVGTITGQIVGTPMYMAPEQAAGTGSVDHRTDLFGLGATTWESLTGCRPRQGSDIRTILAQAREIPVPAARNYRPDVTPEFERILTSLIAMAPEDRYQSASLFMEDLDRYRYGRRRPYGATVGSAFIAVPFHASFDRLFDFLQDVCGEAKLAARRVDRVSEMKDIWHQIDKEIRRSTVVIAVFSRERWRHAPNANVLTEAAHARAIGRPLLILTTDRAEQLPFDWRHLPIIRYSNSQRGLKALREELMPRLRQETRAEKTI